LCVFFVFFFLLFPLIFFPSLLSRTKNRHCFLSPPPGRADPHPGCCFLSPKPANIGACLGGLFFFLRPTILFRPLNLGRSGVKQDSKPFTFPRAPFFVLPCPVYVEPCKMPKLNRLTPHPVANHTPLFWGAGDLPRYAQHPFPPSATFPTFIKPPTSSEDRAKAPFWRI